jgi:sarcosine oxidase subunit gamma
MPDAAMLPRSAFASLAAPSDRSSGVLVSDRNGLGLATVLARKQQRERLAARVREHFGIELPHGPWRAATGDVAFAGTGPGGWLATCEAGANAFAITLTQLLGGVASVADQSDGFAVLRLSGPRVRDALGKLLAIDLHPSAFRPGDVAATIAAHIGVTLWRLEDDAGGVPVFEMAAFRSLAESLWHAIGESAAEYGIALVSV